MYLILLGSPDIAGVYTLIGKEDWYFEEENLPESCKDSCIYVKDGKQYCFSPTHDSEDESFCGIILIKTLLRHLKIIF